MSVADVLPATEYKMILEKKREEELFCGRCWWPTKAVQPLKNIFFRDFTSRSHFGNFGILLGIKLGNRQLYQVTCVQPVLYQVPDTINRATT